MYKYTHTCRERERLTVGNSSRKRELSKFLQILNRRNFIVLVVSPDGVPERMNEFDPSSDVKVVERADAW